MQRTEKVALAWLSGSYRVNIDMTLTFNVPGTTSMTMLLTNPHVHVGCLVLPPGRSGISYKWSTTPPISAQKQQQHIKDV